MIPKNNTEKINNAAVECTPFTPALMKSPISETVNVPVNTKIKAVTVDTPTKASAGIVIFRKSSTMIMIMVANPRTASIVSLMINPLFFLLFQTGL